jgi:hypothetical protein
MGPSNKPILDDDIDQDYAGLFRRMDDDTAINLVRRFVIDRQDEIADHVHTMAMQELSGSWLGCAIDGLWIDYRDKELRRLDRRGELQLKGETTQE